MIEIVKWKANDGSEWGSQENCIARERMIEDVDRVMALLKPHPTELNWEGYVQHDLSSILECKHALFKIANQEGVLKWWIDEQKTKYGKTEKELIEDVHVSWFCRMLDGGNRPLDLGYTRLYCIDEKLREWNQPYFAMNPGKGIDRCVG